MDAELLSRVHRMFRDAGLPYAVVGRAAAAVWDAGGETDELEVLARVQPGEADDLLAAAQANGFQADPGLAALAMEDGEHLTLFHDRPTLVDVKPARGAGDMAALRTRVERTVGEARVWVAAPEETVARLLDEGSDDALAAARRLLRQRRARIDHRYLGQRCEELGVAHLLREVLPEAPAA